MKRILDCHASDFAAMSGRELLAAIAGSEGRTIACETIGALMPMLGDITNAEFAAAMGADAVINGTMDNQHVDTAVPLLKAGYDMLLEKPLAIHEDEMWRLVNTAK